MNKTTKWIEYPAFFSQSPPADVSRYNNAASVNGILPVNENEIVIDVRVVPRASRTQIVGFIEGVLKVRIAAPPVEGAANTELVKMLAKAFDVSKSSVQIVGGETSKNKRVRITGASKAVIQQVLRA